MMRLNGWQRFWILLSVIYGLTVLIFSLMSFPTSKEYEQQKLYAYMESASRFNQAYNSLINAGFSQKEIDEYVSKGNFFDKADIQENPLDSPQVVRNKYYSDLSDDQILKKIREKYSKKVDLNKIEAEYQRNLDNLKKQRFQFIGFMILLWIIPITSIYLLGMSINWVVRGFKHNGKA